MSIHMTDDASEWEEKHKKAREFLDGNSDVFDQEWERYSQGAGLCREAWEKFIESKKIWSLACSFIETFSPGTQKKLGYSEVPEDGIWLRVDEEEKYSLVPVKRVEFPAEIEYTTQQFLKSVFMYFFARKFEVEFTVIFTFHKNFTRKDCHNT